MLNNVEIKNVQMTKTWLFSELVLVIRSFDTLIYFGFRDSKFGFCLNITFRSGTKYIGKRSGSSLQTL
jgi:hypothetical protein